MRECFTKRHARRHRMAFALIVCSLVPMNAAAQAGGSAPVTVKDAVQLAVKNYPRIAESRARAEAADAGIGLARTASDSNLTATGDLMGTLRYMSPEQAMARHGLVDHRTDSGSARGLRPTRPRAARPRAADRCGRAVAAPPRGPAGAGNATRALPARAASDA